MVLLSELTWLREQAQLWTAVHFSTTQIYCSQGNQVVAVPHQLIPNGSCEEAP